MYVLYVDESGDGGFCQGSTKHLLLAGAAMHEGQWNKLTKALDDIQAKYFPQGGGPIEFHCSDIRGGRKAFRGMPRAERDNLLIDVYKVIGSTNYSLQLFGAVIDKLAFMYKYNGKVDPYQGGFESLCTMFNYFLRRTQKKTGNVLRGIVVFDESRPSLSKQIRQLLAQYQAAGTRWDAMTNLIETAFFFDSQTSRLVQIADFAAYAVFRWYEHGDDSYLRIIQHKFNRFEGKLHGLKCYPVESSKPYPPK